MKSYKLTLKLRLVFILVMLAFGGMPTTPGYAQGGANEARLVKDINPAVGSSSNPHAFTNVNGLLFFVANDGAHGEELWKSDGTEAGTVLVKDITPGSSSTFFGSEFVNIDGTLFFIVHSTPTKVDDWQLWKSDGTANGTVKIKSVGPVSGRSFIIKHLANMNHTLYFVSPAVNNPFNLNFDYNELLWKSDGTTAGTMPFTDIYFPGSSGGVVINYLTPISNTLFFAGSDGTDNAKELWRSDGITASRVKDIFPCYSSDVRNLTNVNGTLFFSAEGGYLIDPNLPCPAPFVSYGAELWKSDGTATSTVMVKDIFPGTTTFDTSSPYLLTNVNGVLFFIAKDSVHGDELWKSDGTEAGTVLVKDVNPGSSSCCGLGANHLVNVNGTLFFTAQDGVHNGGQTGHSTLWKSDGTEAGTVLVKDVSVWTSESASTSDCG